MNRPVINTYYDLHLDQADIDAGRHRDAVGGLWEQIGLLQYHFLLERGLRRDHHLVDIGCGALRGGIHFVRYLDAGRYHGIDLSAAMIEAARHELRLARLLHKEPRLIEDDAFAMTRFGECFDYALAMSLFTHLPLNHIIRCLVETRKVLAEGGRLYATFFEAPAPAHLEPIRHEPGGIVTYYDNDPYHLSFDECAWAGRQAGLNAELIGEWQHPRDQRMLCFTPA